MQVQRPPGHRRKVYGKKKTKALDEIFHMSLEAKATTPVDQENQNLAEQFESLRIDDSKGEHDLPDRTATRVEPPKSSSSKTKGKGKPTDSASNLNTNDQSEVSDVLKNVLILSNEKNYESRLEKLKTLSESNLDFETYAARVEKKCIVEKCGEGTYAEAYALSNRDDPDMIHAILKIIPIRPARSWAPNLTPIGSIYHEFYLHELMRTVPGFAQMCAFNIVSGPYPQYFSKATNVWRPEETYVRRNLHAKYPAKQYYAIMELTDAGADGEVLTNPSVFAVLDVFWQLVLYIANAETQLNFEHRDLHISNVCVHQWANDLPLDVNESVLAGLDAKTPVTTAGLSNIRPTIIDFGLARTNTLSEEMPSMWNSLVHLSKFTDIGDSVEDKRQYNSYRRSMQCIDEVAAAKKVRGPPRYGLFAPKTNVVWLVALLWILHRRGGRRVVAGGLAGVQEENWAVVEEMLGRWAWCGVGDLPEGADALLGVALEKGWLKMEGLAAYKAKIGGR